MRGLIIFIIPKEQFADRMEALLWFPLFPEMEQEAKPSTIRLLLIWSHLTVWLGGAGILSIFNIGLKHSLFVVLLWAQAASELPVTHRAPSLQASGLPFHASNSPFLSVVSCSFSSPSCLFLWVSLLPAQHVTDLLLQACKEFIAYCCHTQFSTLHNFLLFTLYIIYSYFALLILVCKINDRHLCHLAVFSLSALFIIITVTLWGHFLHTQLLCY